MVETMPFDFAPLRIQDLRHTAVSVVLDRYGHLYPQHDLDLLSAMEARTSVGPRSSGYRQT